jgi:hypothetical protein
MDALVEAGFDTALIGYSIANLAPNNGMKLREFNAYSMMKTVNIMGLPSSFAHELSQCEPRQTTSVGLDPSDLHLLIEGSFSIPWPQNSIAHYRASLQAAGVYEIDPVLTIKLACENGEASAISGLKSVINWTALAPKYDTGNGEHFMVKTLRRCENNRARHENYEDAILAVIEKSLADGAYEAVFKPYPGPAPMHSPNAGEHQAQPYSGLIDNGFARVMVRMVELGLDPTAPGVPGALSPLDYADKVGSGVGGAMRSFLAREKARAVIAEIGKEAENVKAPKP